MTIDIERLKQRCDHADGGDDPCDLVMDTQTVRELIAIAERHDELAAHVELFKAAVKPLVGYNLAGAGPVISEIVSAYWAAPEDSAAKLKAQWQAESLRKFARGIEKLAGITSGQRMAAEARDMADYIESGGES